MKNKRLTNQHIYMVIMAVAVFLSCEKDENLYQGEQPEGMEEEQIILNHKDELIEKYAFMLAVSLIDPELRTEIKKEAELKFDGDYDILTTNLNHKILSQKNIQVKALLAQTYTQNLHKIQFKSCNKLDEVFFDKISKEIPNLQVSVPVHCEEWDTKSHIPLVVFLPYNFNENNTNSVPAYDINGTQHMLSLLEEPHVPVIVVRVSERIDENGEKIGRESEVMTLLPPSFYSSDLLKNALSAPSDLNISHGPAGTIILEWSDADEETGYEVWRMLQPDDALFLKLATTGTNDNGYINNNIRFGSKVWYKVRAIHNDGFSSWSPIMATTVSPRNDGEWLKIKKMSFTESALKAVESWVSGAPELRLRVVQGSENGASVVFTSGRMEPARRKDIQDIWWNKEIQIFTWCTNTYGTVLTFDWQEEDNISKLDFTVNASYEAKALGGTIKAGGSVKFTADKNGSIGNTSVMWWHDRDQIYDLSGFKWQFVY